MQIYYKERYFILIL